MMQKLVNWWNSSSYLPTPSKGGNASFVEVYFLGIALVILGHSVFWPFGFFLGFWEMFISTMIVSTAFIILCACISEMTSILPFSGGAYGFARVTTGAYWGYIVGFFDSISNIIYVTLYVRSFLDFFLQSFKLTETAHLSLYPLWWFLIYAGITALHLLLNKYSFKFISAMGFICLMIPVMYILGTAKLQNFDANVTRQESHHDMFAGGIKPFLQLLPFSSILYFGVDMICLACEDTKNAVLVVPRVIMAVVATLFVLGILLVFCVPSQPPGIIAAQFNPLPMVTGFATIFDITPEHATIHVLPAYFLMIYSLVYVYGRQMCAMARSAILPRPFAFTTAAGNVPYNAILLGNLLGYLIMVIEWWGTKDYAAFKATGADTFYTAQMGSITVYIISMLSFIIFRYKYSTLERHFVNRLGTPSALLAMTIFAFIWVSLGFYQYNYFPIKAFACLFALATAYYVLYARRYQSFSPEEESILLTVYVIKANSRRRTVYKWLETRVLRWLRRVDSYHLFIDARQATRSKPPSSGGSKSSGDLKVNSGDPVAAASVPLYNQDERLCEEGGASLEDKERENEGDLYLQSVSVISRADPTLPSLRLVFQNAEVELDEPVRGNARIKLPPLTPTGSGSVVVPVESVPS